MNDTNDKELLEMAAKAADIELGDWSSSEGGFIRYHFITRHIWNPLTDDGDALRLAVKLDLVVLSDASGISTCSGQKHRAKELHGADPYSATRRAISRAAAEIGRAMP